MNHIFYFNVLLFLSIGITSFSQSSDKENLNFINSFFHTMNNPCQKLSVKTYTNFFSKYSEFDSEYFLYNSFNDCEKKEYINYKNSNNIKMEVYKKKFPNAYKIDSIYVNIILENPDLFDSQLLISLKSFFDNKKLYITSNKLQTVEDKIGRYYIYTFSIKDGNGRIETLKIILDKKNEYKIADVLNSNNKSLLSLKEYYWTL